MNDNDFEFIGLPSNDPVEMETNSSPINIPNENESLENLLKQTGLDKLFGSNITNTLAGNLFQQILSSLSEAGGPLDSFKLRISDGEETKDVDMGAFLNEALNNKAPLDNILQEMFENADLSQENIKNSQEEEKVLISRRKSEIIKALMNPDNFGRVAAKYEFNLLGEFQKEFGFKKDDVIFFPIERIIKDGNIDVSAPSEEFLEVLENVHYVVPVAGSPKFILFECYPNESFFDDPNDFEDLSAGRYHPVTGFEPFFIAMYKKPDEEFALIIPTSANTFNPDTKSFYTADDNPELFDKDKEFKFHDPQTVCNELENILFEEKTVLVKLSDLGTVRNIIPVIKDSSSFIECGVFTFNNSEKARFMKIDSGLRDDENDIPFVVSLPREYSKDELAIIGNFLFKMKFHENRAINNETFEIKNGKAIVPFNPGPIPEIGLLEKE